MHSPLTFHNAKKHQRVILAKDLPVGQAFGNKRIIKQNERGDVLSNGFESGRLKVRFYSHYFGQTMLSLMNEVLKIIYK